MLTGDHLLFSSEVDCLSSIASKTRLAQRLRNSLATQKNNQTLFLLPLSLEHRQLDKHVSKCFIQRLMLVRIWGSAIHKRSVDATDRLYCAQSLTRIGSIHGLDWVVWLWPRFLI